MANLKKILKQDLKKVQNENDSKGVYGLEITTTQACNFQCSYCFEKEHSPEENLLDARLLVKRIKQLLDSEWFQDQYSGIKLILWGGEPTMNMPLCKALMEVFREDERVCFFMYTNGSTIDNLMPTLKRLKDQSFIKDNLKKVTIQVSYDGNPLHDYNRLTKKGTSTSEIVLHAIKQLQTNGIDYGLKATLTWKDFDYITETWEDFNKLYKRFGSNIKYSLTMDYYDVEFSRYDDIIEKKLIELAQKEIKFFRKHGYFLSNIFKGNRALCATGKNMACIDTNGDVYNCHGAIYSEYSNDLKYTNIFDKDFINSIQKANSLYANNHLEPDECQECIASSCLRCNVKKYEESKKETHLDKWFDYPAQFDLCKYFKLVGKINAAIESILRKK